MKMKTLLAALALTLAPGLAVAMCSGNYQKDEVAMTCAAGTTWDSEMQRCVATTS